MQDKVITVFCQDVIEKIHLFFDGGLVLMAKSFPVDDENTQALFNDGSKQFFAILFENFIINIAFFIHIPWRFGFMSDISRAEYRTATQTYKMFLK